VQGTKNPRWGEEEEDDAAEKGTNEGIRVFYPGQAYFIYKHVLMGLWRGKAQSIFLGFTEQMVKRIYRIKEEMRKRKEEKRVGNKRVSVKKHKFTSSSTRGLAA
jgi:hypothetical protein